MTSDNYPKFLPQWTNAIEHICGEGFLGIQKKNQDTMSKAKQDFNLNWWSGKCCLTGEAFFHQSAPILCSACNNFTYGASHDALKTRNGLYKYKKELAEHLQESHPQTWAKWGIKV